MARAGLDVDLAAIEPVYKAVLQALDEAGAPRVAIRGGQGTGRHTLAARLEHEGRAWTIEVPDVSADAAAHCLLQAAVKTGVETHGTEPLDRNLDRVAEALRKDGRALCVVADDLWWRRGDARDPDELALRRRTRTFFDALTARADVKLVFISSDVPPGFPLTAHTLPRVDVSARELERAELWGDYSPAAARLRKLVARGARPAPLILRLAVGVAAVAPDRAQDVADSIGRGEPFAELMRWLVRSAAVVPELLPALERYALCRAPLPADRLLSAVAPPAGHAPLFTRCLGYGDDDIRLSAMVGRTLRAELAKVHKAEREPDDVRRERRQHAHQGWAEARRALDGTLDPAELDRTRVIHWLEKVHHLARSGPEGAKEWSEQRIEHAELLWDRARHLSRVEHDYAGAAVLYRRCIGIDAGDAYAWHYLGFNLDRAGTDAEAAEKALRQARDLEPTNPWWNSRLVTFLIERGCFQQAEEAWRTAVEALDPDGLALTRRPELAPQLHRWVVSAWLDRGEIKRARAVLDVVPENAKTEILRSEYGDRWREIENRLQDAEEALALGEVVRPTGMAADERWRPSVLPEKLEGRSLGAWYPARIRRMDEESIELVLAVPHQDPALRRVLRKTLTAAAWKAISSTTLPPETDQFFEIGEFGDRTLAAPLPRQLTVPLRIDRASLRYLDAQLES